MKRQSIADKIIWHDSLPSTMSEAQNLAKRGAKHGTIIAAKTQTGGRGRRGRNWSSDMGGAWFSMILRPKTKPEYVQRLSLIASVAVVYAISDWFTGKCAEIKWPNDVMLAGKKIAGILLESSVTGDTVEYVALGVGINVSQVEFPPEISCIATSLYLEGSRDAGIGGVIDSFHKYFMRGYNAFELSDPLFFWESFRRTYKHSSNTLGKDILVLENDVSYSACAMDIGEHGELIVNDGDGNIRRVYAADVSVRDKCTAGV